VLVIAAVGERLAFAHSDRAAESISVAEPVNG